jgi:hypothetical protein
VAFKAGTYELRLVSIGNSRALAMPLMCRNRSQLSLAQFHPFLAGGSSRFVTGRKNVGVEFRHFSGVGCS